MNSVILPTLRRAFLNGTLSFSLAGIAWAADPSPALVRDLPAGIETAMRDQAIPGLSVAIARDHRLVFEQGFGFADLENRVPATAKTVYRTASIAKPMTAVIALRLAEEGKLDLDAPIQRYLPEFPAKDWPVTSRQLLGHLGGVRHYGKPGESTGTRHYRTIGDALAIFAGDPLVHEPGTRFLYSTFGYNLVGAAAEAAGGRDFATLVKEMVADPIGSKTLRADDHFAVIPNRAHGYAWQRGRITNANLHDTSMKIPGGGLIATAGDLATFAFSVNEGKLLKPETVADMWTPQRTTQGVETRYGLGWKLKVSGKSRIVYHSGGQAGTSTYLILEPASGNAVALMCNLEGARLQALAETLLQRNPTPEMTTPATDSPKPDRKRFALVVHGGAGTLPTDREFRNERQAGMHAALTLGRDMLDKGASSLDTVEAVVRLLEDHPAFNAGKGSVLNADGEAECDASIMDGRNLACGASAATKRTRNPVSLARAILADGRHVLLGGEGADRFAAEKGLERVKGGYFVTPLQRELLEKASAEAPPPTPGETDSRGTVGCVALDEDGNLAAATSTGGRRNKVPGRIGDSPVIGAGTYANNATCAVSGTGIGEEYIRLAAAYDVHARMAYLGKSLDDAVRDVLFTRMKPGDGGMIGVDAGGNMTMLFNTPGMARAAADSSGTFTVEVEEVPEE